MKTFLFVLLATSLEASGDAVVRIALRTHNHVSVRVALFLAGAVALTLYGTCLNLAPVEFAQVTGIYIATLFVVFQLANYVFFRTMPTAQVAIGGGLIVAGGLVVGFWR
jgi:small multidrug resistance family-3 protein